MTSLQLKISERLLGMGAALALERRQMMRRSDPGHPVALDRGQGHQLYVMDMLGLLSNAAIRLGVAVMPDHHLLPDSHPARKRRRPMR